MFSPGFNNWKLASSISSIFDIDDCVLMKFQIMSNKLIIAQFYVDYDFYFDGEVNKNGNVIIHNSKVKGLKVKVDLTGFKNLEGEIESKKNYFLSDENTDYKFSLGNNDFAFAYLYFS